MVIGELNSFIGKTHSIISTEVFSYLEEQVNYIEAPFKLLYNTLTHNNNSP